MAASDKIIVSTTDTVAGREIAEVLDVVVGMVTNPNAAYGQDVRESMRVSALDRLRTNASKIGADAVVGVRFDSLASDYSSILEYTAYGTAVKLV